MKLYLIIPGTYLLFGICWILFSDLLLAAFSGEAEQIILAQIIKGCFFVISSSILIFFVTCHAEKRLKAQEQKRREEQKAMLAEVHHILLNYLNQMELMNLEAERCEDFDKKTISLARQLSDEAATELKKLSSIYLDHKASAPSNPA